MREEGSEWGTHVTEKLPFYFRRPPTNVGSSPEPLEQEHSKTLHYLRTNPREYQLVIAHTKETICIQDPASPNHQQHPVQDASSKQQTNQNCKPNHQQRALPPHSTFPIREKTSKQTTKTQDKFHPIRSSHKQLDQHQEGRKQKEGRLQTSSRKEFNFP